MFRRIYTPLVFVLALALIALSFWQDSALGSNSVNAAADLTFNGENVAVVATSQGVLDQVSTTVTVNVEVSDNVLIDSAFGHFSDMQAWLDGIHHYNISGLKDWQAEYVQEDSGSDFDTQNLSTNSDMWDAYTRNTGSINVAWTKKSNQSWAMLLVLKTTDGTPLNNAKVNFSWSKNDPNGLTMILLSLAIILLASIVVLNVIWRNKNKRGTHSGDSKRLVDVLNASTGEFILPKSSQIPNVREFAKVKQNMDAQSTLLTGHVTDVGAYSNSSFQTSQNSLFVSPVEDNNWRYYDADSSQKEYYDAQISRTADFTDSSNFLVANNSSDSIPDIIQFNAVQKLENHEESDSKLSRKELRQSGFFQKRLKKRDEND